MHAVADTFDLHGPALDRATDLAARDDPRRYNYYGGMDTFILAVVASVTFEHDRGVDDAEFHRIRREWGVDLDDLIAATRKVGERA